MRHLRPVILLTGFGPFPGVPQNVSAALAPMLARRARRAFPGYDVHAEVLPTEWERGPARAAALLQSLRPALAIHFGVSSKASGLTLETRAHRLARPLCDAAGLLPPPCLHDAAPEVLRSSLPAWLAIERLRQLQIPAALSRDAGGYLCNAVLYASLHGARRLGLTSRIGFVHLPHRLAPDLPPSAGYGAGVPSWSLCAATAGLSWRQALTGGLVIIATGLGRAPVMTQSRLAAARDGVPALALHARSAVQGPEIAGRTADEADLAIAPVAQHGR